MDKLLGYPHTANRDPSLRPRIDQLREFSNENRMPQVYDSTLRKCDRSAKTIARRARNLADAADQKAPEAAALPEAVVGGVGSEDEKQT
jgi:hypothetical protein